MLAPRPRHLLRLEERQVLDDRLSRVARLDHAVDEAALGGVAFIRKLTGAVFEHTEHETTITLNLSLIHI